jgi:hypothetical protein
MKTLHKLTLALGSMSLGAATAIFYLGLAGAVPMVLAIGCATMVGGGGIGLIFSPLIDDERGAS